MLQEYKNLTSPAPARRREYLAIAATIVAGILFWPALIYCWLYLHSSFISNIDAIPRHFEITETIFQTRNVGFIEGCGGTVFRLSPATITAIQERGLDFINQDLDRRDSEKPKNASYHSYTTWATTPPQIKNDNKPYWIGLQCLQEENPELAEIISKALYSDSAFYTIGIESELLIVPEKGYIVFLYFG